MLGSPRISIAEDTAPWDDQPVCLALSLGASTGMIPANKEISKMASTLATLARTENGFRGTLSTLTIKAPIAVLENRTKKEGSDEPDFRVIATKNGFEVGAAWTRTSKTSGKEYISVSLTAPEFGKIFANIAQAPGGREEEYVMIWNPGDQN